MNIDIKLNIKTLLLTCGTLIGWYVNDISKKWLNWIKLMKLGPDGKKIKYYYWIDKIERKYDLCILNHYVLINCIVVICSFGFSYDIYYILTWKGYSF